MKWPCSISGQLGVLYLIVALCPVVVVVVITNMVFTRTIQEERSEALAVAADATLDRIEDYIRTRINDINTLSMMPMWALILSSEAHIVQPPPPIHAILAAYVAEKEYHDLLLIDAQGNVRYSVVKELDLGQNIYEYPLSETQLALTVESSNTLLLTEVSNFSFYPPTGGHAAFLASPIFSDGVIIGTLVLQVDQEALNRIVNRYQGLGRTGEILTASMHQGELMITTTSRHSPGLFGDLVCPDTFWPFVQALSGHQGGSIYTDHRGKEVLAEWRYLPSLNWGLITQIDTRELFAPIHHFTRTLRWILLLAASLALIGILLSHQWISGPLIRFAAAVKSLSKNKLPESLPIEGRYEIAALGHRFNELIAAIRAYQQDLEAMVEKRTQDLQHALHQAKEANKAKSTFLATMSHEIRTPLNGVIGFTELLKTTPLNEIQKDYAHHAQTAGRALLGILNNVLDLSKIEAGGLELDLQRRNVLAIIRDSIDIVLYQAEQKGLHVLVQLPPDLPYQADVDEVRLKQICVNLLGNAIKFTRKGQIIIQIQHAPTAPDRCRYTISVQDSGIGIKPEEQQKLFQAFSQADSSTSRKYGGTGLGLIISRLLVEKMGGQIKLESEFNKGTTFTFDFETTGAMTDTIATALPDTTPLQQPVHPRQLTELLKSLDQQMVEDRNKATQLILKKDQSVTVLVAEDVALNMLLTRALLKKIIQGVKIYEATDGIQVVSLAAKHRPDIIFMDIHMPGQDGLAATRQIREQEKENAAQRIPIVALTAGVMTEDRAMALNSGMDDFLIKPLDYHALYTALETGLKDKIAVQ